MHVLSTQSFSEARGFIHDHGRLLEQALFAHAFEGGRQEAVLEELARYQNPDGGFGHALEPDFRCADSSAVATTIAFQILRELQVPSQHPLVQRGIAYFLATYEPAGRYWLPTPPAVNDAPHAPWWHWADDMSQRTDQFLANPRAEIVGYLLEHARLVPEALLRELTDAADEHLHRLPDAMQMHDLLCYVQLAQTKGLAESLHSRLMAKLRCAVDATVVKDPSRWTTYCLRPLDVVQDANSPFAAQLAAALEQNLDFEIPRQADDGGWPLNFSWGSAYPEVAPTAAREWRGCRTFRLLVTLRSFGRLASGRCPV